MHILDLTDTQDSLKQLAKWHHAEWEHLNPGKTLEMRIEEMQEYLEGKPVPRTFVFKNGDQLMGSAAIIESDMNTRPELKPWLASVYVEKEFRKRGIGSKLVKQIMKYAREIGIETLYLYTEHEESLYEKLGWERISIDEYMERHVVVMKTNLLQTA